MKLGFLLIISIIVTYLLLYVLVKLIVWAVLKTKEDFENFKKGKNDE